MKLACKPLWLSCLTAIFVSFKTPLYTPPNPPSPSMRDRLKFFVALFNSSTVKTLRWQAFLLDKHENETLEEDSVLMSVDTFCELYSDPLRSESVKTEADDWPDVDFLVLLWSSLENWKHFIPAHITKSYTQFLANFFKHLFHYPCVCWLWASQTLLVKCGIFSLD